MSYEIAYKKYKKKFIYKNLPVQKKRLSKKTYKYCIIIPVYNEYPIILDTLDSINDQQKDLLRDTLVVLVINNNMNANSRIINNNLQTHITVNNKQYNYECISLDYYSQKKAIAESKFGVGVARKIGMDFILHYSTKSSLILSLDADTKISNKYLLSIVQYYHQKKFRACTVNFKHQKSNNSIVNQGIKIYEDELYNMAYQIKKSKSPYGYISMGSTMICTVQAYIAIGGMCQRKAAEDFYFLQALAKYTKIHNIKDILVFPSSRNEQRVHLGTGYRMKEYKETKQFKNLFFSNTSYQILKEFISLVDKNYKQPYSSLNKELNKYFDYNICNFLRNHKLNNIWDKINYNAKSKKQFMLFFHQWFDALKIMQLLKSIN